MGDQVGGSVGRFLTLVAVWRWRVISLLQASISCLKKEVVGRTNVGGPPVSMRASTWDGMGFSPHRCFLGKFLTDI